MSPQTLDPRSGLPIGGAFFEAPTADASRQTIFPSSSYDDPAPSFP